MKLDEEHLKDLLLHYSPQSRHKALLSDGKMDGASLPEKSFFRESPVAHIKEVDGTQGPPY